MKLAIATIGVVLLAAPASVVFAGGAHGGGGMGATTAGAQSATSAGTNTSTTTTTTTTATGPNHTTGQPNQSCSNFPSAPGGSATASGSAFNPNGTAGGVYAGQQTQNQKGTVTNSQYDVACSKQP